MKTKNFLMSMTRRGLLMLALLTMISTNAWATKTYTYNMTYAGGTGAAGSDVSYWYTNVGCTTHCKIENGTNNRFTSATTIYYKDASLPSTAFTVTPAGTSTYATFKLNSKACYFFLGKQNATFTLPTYSGEKITNVTITRGAGGSNSATVNIYSGTNAASTQKTFATAGSDYSFDITSTYQSDALTIKLDGDYNTSFNQIVITTEAAKSLVSIAHKTDPTKTAYVAGEDFAPAGLVITATYDDSSTEDIDYNTHSGDFSFSPSTSLTAGTTSVTVTYGGQTCSQSIAVYSVTMQAKDQNGNAIAAGGPGTPSRTGASISPAADAGNYKFWKWEISGASLGSAATTKSNTITNPTGAVTVTAKYYLPRTVTWKVNGEVWTPYTTTGSGTDGTAVVTRGAQWKTLTLPTDPTTSDGCGQKFMGWTQNEIDGSLDKTDDAAAISTLVTNNLLNTGNKSSKTNPINDNTTFHAVFVDYAE